jgi:hypothetical protein
MFKREDKKQKKKHELSECVVIVISFSVILAVVVHDTLASMMLLCFDFLAAFFDKVRNNNTFGDVKNE